MMRSTTAIGVSVLSWLVFKCCPSVPAIQTERVRGIFLMMRCTVTGAISCSDSPVMGGWCYL